MKKKIKDYIVGSVWIGTILEIKEMKTNSSFNYSKNCGIYNCPATKLLESASKPTVKSVYVLCGTLLISTFVSMMIAILFIDDLKYDENLNPINRQTIKLSLISNFWFEV